MNQIKIHPLVIYLAICNLIIAKNFQKSLNFHKYYVGQKWPFSSEMKLAVDWADKWAHKLGINK